MAKKVVIVGGGVVGSATAYFLALSDPSIEITVIERDPSYAHASSALSAAGIRQQFSTPLGVRMSAYGVEFLRSIGSRLAVSGEQPVVHFHEAGYLFLADAVHAQILRENQRMQVALGADIALLERNALKETFPWLRVDDLDAGAYGRTGEGWLDGFGLLQAFRKKAQALGARYVAAEVTDLKRGARRVEQVVTGDGQTYGCDVLVNAAGPWARNIASMLEIDLPVFARRRSVFHVSSPAKLERCPLLIDPTGVWFRPEGSGFICGIAPAPEDDHDDLPLHEVDHRLFDEIVWPTLASRVPQFEAMRVQGSWSGYYEHNVFDHNAIIGTHPDVENCIFANGFSGHGLQHSPATGRGVSELIVHGKYMSLDLSALGWDRLLQNRPIVEVNVV